MKSWLENNDIEMHSTHNKRKPVVAERFIRTLRSRVYNNIASISKNVYIDKLGDIVNKCNNTYPRAFPMKPVVLRRMHILTLVKTLIIKIPNLKLVVM